MQGSPLPPGALGTWARLLLGGSSAALTHAGAAAGGQPGSCRWGARVAGGHGAAGGAGVCVGTGVCAHACVCVRARVLVCRHARARLRVFTCRGVRARVQALAAARCETRALPTQGSGIPHPLRAEPCPRVGPAKNFLTFFFPTFKNFHLLKSSRFFVEMNPS